ncbi:hypothetical protein IV203_026940 [Nitzschia inconspicua]|uniref:EGF-like domain-containing protein n=1 Tax=Nitzschia inconspicua TaxID=303405 RepID=A0A9K3LKL5_9STRA|nr:hypothetical protein IV203_026940 [Nitzschia inconspicua]
MMKSNALVMMFGTVLLLETIGVDASQCPVSSDLSKDGHLYVTNTDELTEECQCFSVHTKDLCSSVTNTTSDIGILGDFECIGKCHGFVLNPEYVFWDAAQGDWRSLDACTDSPFLTTCDDVGQIIQCDVSYCANGVFKCQREDGSLCGGTVERPQHLKDCPSTITVATGATAMDIVTYIFSPEGIFNVQIHGINDELYTAITHSRTCTGQIDYTFDSEGNHCPPAVVSSFEEIEHYCMHGGISTFSDGRFKCEFDGQEPCNGKVDPILVPACEASTITSCEDAAYYEACTYEVRSTDTNRAGYEPEYVKFCSGEAFHCWDKRANQWCQGRVVPTFGSFDVPVCPSVVASCDSLEQFGINHRNCSCFDMNGFGGFVCGDWDNPYCKGEVDEMATLDDAEITPIDSSLIPSANEDSNKPTAEPSSNDEVDESDVVFSRTDSTSPPIKHSTTLIPLLLASVVALAAVAAFSVGYRRYRREKKIEMRRADLAAALELTAHYRGDEDIDFGQHPRRLMIL